MQILFSSDINQNGRLFKSPGLRRVEDDTDDVYRKGALIPAEPILPSRDFFDESVTGMHDSIACFKVDDPQFQQFVESLGFWDLNNYDELKTLVNERRTAYEIFKRKCVKIMSEYASDSHFNLHDVYLGGRNQLTSTIDYDSDSTKKIGMHFDTWDVLAVDELMTSRNRICINIGQGVRYFLFTPKSVFEMKEELVSINDDYAALSSSYDIGVIYANEIGVENIPVYFVRLEPFEGYIASTETVFHDGSNFDSNFLDLQITARGFFDPLKVKN